MFADPQVITFPDASTATLPRIGSGSVDRGLFKSSDATWTLSYLQTSGKRLRHTARLDVQRISADPFLPSTNVTNRTSCYLVVDRPIAGFTLAENVDYARALASHLTASSGAALSKLLGGEI